jgi:Cu(I)/Ag(I) efflux system membrane fusion protein
MIGRPVGATGRGAGRPGRRGAAAVALLAIAAMMALLATAGCQKKEGARGGEGGETRLTPVGPFRVGVRNRPLPPSVGDNTFIVTLRDSAGAAVPGADVGVLVVMEAMGQMPRMESRGEVKEVRPGVYEAKYGLAMSGEWDLSLRLKSREGVEAIANYRLSTSLKEVTFAGGTPPVGGGAAPGGAGHVHGGAGGGGEVSGEVLIDPARRQAIGIRTGPAQKRDLRVTIRAAGRVAYDETRRTEVSLKFGGWVRDLRVDYTGRPVRAGEVLFTAYSPELFAAQQEYLSVLGRTAGDASSTSAAASPDLAAAARQRLLLWDIAPEQIDAIARAGRPMEAVPIVAPGSGIVVEKNIVRGSAFMAGQTLYRIAPVDPVWVVANVYPFELPLVQVGRTASILTPFLPERSRPGRVAYVSPYIETDTRTGEVRINVPNRQADLKPGMFVDVALDVELGKRLAVPEGAVLYVGDRRVVFVDLGDGRLAPRDVTLGARAGEYFEVREGLEEGEIVVTSGNFLVAAESRLKSAAGKW